LSNQGEPRRLIFRWATLKGLAAIVLFVIAAFLIEYVVVLYAMDLGVQEKTDNLLFGFISPLFHLVPLTVIVALTAAWTYLTRHVAARPREPLRSRSPTTKEGRMKKTFAKIGSGLLKIRGVSYVRQRVYFARAAIRSALIVLLAFVVLALVVSLFTYPQLIYQTILGAYGNDAGLHNFILGADQSLASFGAALNGALLAAAPGFRDFALGFGNLIAPLAGLDNTGKYLMFQNAAAWISGLAVLMHGEYAKAYRYRRKGRS